MPPNFWERTNGQGVAANVPVISPPIIQPDPIPFWEVDDSGYQAPPPPELPPEEPQPAEPVPATPPGPPLFPRTGGFGGPVPPSPIPPPSPLYQQAQEAAGQGQQSAEEAANQALDAAIQKFREQGYTIDESKLAAYRAQFTADARSSAPKAISYINYVPQPDPLDPQVYHEMDQANQRAAHVAANPDVSHAPEDQYSWLYTHYGKETADQLKPLLEARNAFPIHQAAAEAQANIAEGREPGSFQTEGLARLAALGEQNINGMLDAVAGLVTLSIRDALGYTPGGTAGSWAKYARAVSPEADVPQALREIGEEAYNQEPIPVVTGAVRGLVDPMAWLTAPIVNPVIGYGAQQAVRLGLRAIRPLGGLRPLIINALGKVAEQVAESRPATAQALRDEAGRLAMGRTPDPDAQLLRAIKDWSDGKVTWQKDRPYVGNSLAPWSEDVMARFPTQEAFENRAAEEALRLPSQPSPARPLGDLQALSDQALQTEARQVPLWHVGETVEKAEAPATAAGAGEVPLSPPAITPQPGNIVTLYTEPVPASAASYPGATLSRASYTPANPKVYRSAADFTESYAAQGDALYGSLRKEGYGSIYIPNAEGQAGKLIVLNPKAVTLSEPRLLDDAAINNLRSGSEVASGGAGPPSGAPPAPPAAGSPPSPVGPTAPLRPIPPGSPREFLRLKTPGDITADLAANAARWPKQAMTTVVSALRGPVPEALQSAIRGVSKVDVVRYLDGQKQLAERVAQVWSQDIAETARTELRHFIFNKEGRITNLKVTGPASNPMPSLTELVEHGDRYLPDLTSEQRNSLQRVMDVQAEVAAYEKAAGVKRGDVEVPDGSYWHRQYIARQTPEGSVSMDRGGTSRRGFPQPAQRQRTFDDIENALRNGYILDPDPVAGLEGRVRQGLQAVVDKWYAENLKPLGRSVRSLPEGRFSEGVEWSPVTAPPISRHLYPVETSSGSTALAQSTSLLFPREVADAIDATADPRFGRLLGTAQALNQNAFRLITTGHPVVQFVQGGIPMLAHPQVWTEAWWRGVQQAVSPVALLAYRDVNSTILDRLIPYGLDWYAVHRPTEFTASLAGVNGISGAAGRYARAGADIASKVPVAGGFIPFMNRHFATDINVLRTEIAKFYFGETGERSFGMSDNEIRRTVQVVNNLVGGYTGNITRPESLFEGAPRFFRSILNLHAEALKGGMSGTMARNNLVLVYGNAALLTAIVNKLAGQETEWDLSKPHAWAIKVPGLGVEFSVLPQQIRDLARAAAYGARGVAQGSLSIAATGLELLALAKMGPLYRDVVNQINQGYNIAGQKVGGLDPEEWNTPDKVLRNVGNIALGHAAIPFQNVAQGVRGEMPWAGVAARTIGVPLNAMTPAEERDDLLNLLARNSGLRKTAADGTDAGPVQTAADLTHDQYRQLVDSHPNLAGLIEQSRERAQNRPMDDTRKQTKLWRDRYDAAVEAVKQTLAPSYAAFQAGTMPGKELRARIKAAQSDLQSRTDQLQKDYPLALSTTEKSEAYYNAQGLPARDLQPMDEAVRRYRAIEPPADEFDRQGWRTYFHDWNTFFDSLPPNVRDYVLNQHRIWNDPAMDSVDPKRRQDMQSLRPLFDLQDTLLNMSPVWQEKQLAVDKAPSASAHQAALADPDHQAYQEAYNKSLDLFMRQHPDLDAIRSTWFGTNTVGQKDRKALEGLLLEKTKLEQQLRAAPTVGQAEKIQRQLVWQTAVINRQKAMITNPRIGLDPLPVPPYNMDDALVPTVHQVRNILAPQLFPGARDYAALSPVQQADLDRYHKTLDGWLLQNTPDITDTAHLIQRIAQRSATLGLMLPYLKTVPFRPTPGASQP